MDETFKNLEETLKNNEEESIKDHQSYRESGLKMMVGIIGLSVGILSYLEGRDPPMAMTYTFPIAGAVLQQSAHYVACFFRARAHNYLSTGRKYIYDRIANEIFNLSDVLCLLTVALFLGLSIRTGVALDYLKIALSVGAVCILITILALGIIVLNFIKPERAKKLL
jgi:hypothetical protein